MTDRVGERFGDYHLLRFLGQGGFGDVYLGEHVYTKAQGVVKVFKAQLTPDKFRNFLNEIRTILLKHPNIIQLLDFGIGEQDIPFVVMEYAPHGTLLQRHPKGTRIPLSTIVTYVKQIADALQYAHEQRRIHRDVKPENMLLGRNNEVLLSDFGITAIAHNTASLKTADKAGTPLYMAPEQIQGKPCPASDQYALAIVVFEWLCGQVPFEGNEIQIIYQKMYEPTPTLRDKQPSIPPLVEQVVMKALSKEPDDRFKRVMAFANALENAYKMAQPMVIPIVLPPQPPAVQTPSPAVGTTLSIRQIPPSDVRAMIWNVDGPRIALAVDDGTIQIWNIATEKLSASYSGHSAKAIRIAWSPNGKRIASLEDVRNIKVWDAATGQHICTYNNHSNSLDYMYWSPDNTKIASVENSRVHVWKADIGGVGQIYENYKLHDDIVALSWSPDSTHIASASQKIVNVWNATTLKEVSSHDYEGGVTDAVWSSDGTHIAITFIDLSTDTSELEIRQWNNLEKLVRKFPSWPQQKDKFHVRDTELFWSPDDTQIVRYVFGMPLPINR